MTGLSVITDALQQAFCCPFEMAKVTGLSRASAWRYWNGRSVPNIALLARLMRQSRGLAMAFWEYCGLDQASLDAESARLRADFADLQRKFEALDADYQRLLAARQKRVASVSGKAPRRTDAPPAPAAGSGSAR
jgi:transcriptional regulator with XRE-family HTH domain